MVSLLFPGLVLGWSFWVEFDFLQQAWHECGLGGDHYVLFKIGKSEVYFRIIIKIVKIMQKKALMQVA